MKYNFIYGHNNNFFYLNFLDKKRYYSRSKLAHDDPVMDTFHKRDTRNNKNVFPLGGRNIYIFYIGQSILVLLHLLPVSFNFSEINIYSRNLNISFF